MNTKAPTYTLKPYSRLRRAAQDLVVFQRTHLIHGLLEVDVTDAREAIEAYRRKTGEHLSFTAFIIACVARAVDEDKSVQAYRKGRRHFVIYDDVDVTTFIDRQIGGQSQATFHIIRAANHKTLQEIHTEIRDTQAAAYDAAPELAGLRVYELLPGWLRRRLLRALGSRPEIWKRRGGTVAVTAVGMFAKGSSGWGIPLTCNTLNVTIGGIGAKPGVVDGHVAVREYLNLTISADHDVIDGAPVARFAGRLKSLIESAYSLRADGAKSPGADSAA